MFKLQFETDNAAFNAENRNHEAARILRKAAELIESGVSADKCRDENGNHIGHFTLTSFGKLTH